MTAPIPWRLLAHDDEEVAHHVIPNGVLSPDDHPSGELHLLPRGTEFDEVVAGQWLHVEQTDDLSWWCSIGGVFLDVRIAADGRPVHVMFRGIEDPRPGCTYVNDDSGEGWTDG